MEHAGQKEATIGANASQDLRAVTVASTLTSVRRRRAETAAPVSIASTVSNAFVRPVIVAPLAKMNRPTTRPRTFRQPKRIAAETMA